MPESLEKAKIEIVPLAERLTTEQEGIIERQEIVEAESNLNKTEDKKINKIEQIKASISTKQTIVVSQEEKERLKKIDKILSAGLEDAYLSLSPELKKEFKVKGEETTIKINMLLNKVKVNFGKIVKLIKKWLLIIPRINPFFLEQEAKIKADRILNLKNKDE